MATLELKEHVHSEYGQGYSWVASSYSSYGGNNGDNNKIYIGGSSGRYRSRISVTIPSTTKIVSSSKLVIKLAGYGQNSNKIWLGKMRAYLSTTNLSSSDYELMDELANPILSYPYSNEACTNRIKDGYSSTSGNYTYFSFSSTNFTAGSTYYIYFLPYSSDTDAIDSPGAWADTWIEWQNNPGTNTSRLSAVLHYSNTITITYDANGGTGAPAAANFTAGVEGTLSSTKPTKGNATRTVATITLNSNGGSCASSSLSNVETTTYSFGSWNTAKAGSGTSYNSGAKITPSTSNITLYAQYNSSASNSKVTAPAASKTNSSSTRTITFNSNGGSSVANQSSTATITYSCNGWWSAASGGTKKANVGDVLDPTANATWYAQYTSSTGTYSSVTLPSCTKTGYSFSGWSDGNTVLAAGTSYTPTGNVTLTAQWQMVTHTFTVLDDNYNCVYEWHLQAGDQIEIPYITLPTRYRHLDNFDFTFRDTLNENEHIVIGEKVNRGYWNNRFYIYSLNTGDYLDEVYSGDIWNISEDVELIAKYDYTDTIGEYRCTAPYLTTNGYDLLSWENGTISLLPGQGVSIPCDEFGSMIFTSNWRQDANISQNLFINVGQAMIPGTSYVKHNNNWYKGLINFVKVDGYWISMTQTIPSPLPGHEPTTTSRLPSEEEVKIPVENYGDYDFILQDGYYYNGNAWYEGDGDQTCCVAKVWFETSKDTHIMIDCYQSSEASYDYAIFSEIDTEISYHYESMDESSLPDGIYTTLKDFNYGDYNSGKPLSTIIEYTIPAGQHFIIIKFQKDGSVCAGEDTFKFMIMQ